MTEGVRGSEDLDLSGFLSPREWYRQFRITPDARTTDNIALLHPEWEKNTHARDDHPENFGKNTRITMVWLRHGEKNADDTLKPEGVKQAQEEMDLILANGFDPNSYDLIHALSSYTGPKNNYGLPRAAETAQASATHILLRGTEKKDVDPIIYPGMPEHSPELSFGDMKFQTPAVRDASYYAGWVQAYADGGYLAGEELEAAKKVLEECEKITDKGARRKKYGELGPILKNADSKSNLSSDERLSLANKATTAALDAITGLNTPEGENFRNESAGSMAHILLHNMHLAENMESGKSAALIAGGHAEVNWEFTLQQALKWKNPKTGKEQVGFESFDDIGGPMRPAESIVVNTVTDTSGQAEIEISFSRKDRPQGTYTLDTEKLHTLAAIWAQMHKDDPKPMTPQEYFDQNIKPTKAVIL